MATPLTDTQLADIERLHAKGLSARKIADKLGLSPSTISRRARKLGLAFDRQQTIAANHARQADMETQRLALAQRMLDRANRSLDQIDGKYLVYNFGGKDNTYEEHTLDSAPTSAVRETMTIAAIAFDKVTRIIEKQAPNSQVEAVNMLTALATAFGIPTPGAKQEDPPKP